MYIIIGIVVAVIVAGVLIWLGTRKPKNYDSQHNESIKNKKIRKRFEYLQSEAEA